MSEAFLGMTVILGLALMIVLPYANSFITKSFPSLTSNAFVVALVQGAVLTAVVLAAKHFLGSKAVE